MLLHELYFENIASNKALDLDSALFSRIVADFGSFENWSADFAATGRIRGIGWVVMYVEPKEGRVVNAWIEEHNLGHLCGATPLLVMDVFEHAYITQFGLDRAQYIDVVMKNINWDVVAKRYEAIKK
jgi:Fe-Mn family superoxide dismutase